MDCMVRGGSSPLGRIEKALLGGDFSAWQVRPSAILRSARIVATDKSEHFSEHPRCAGGLVSYSRAKGGWEVRWRDGSGHQRSRRFRSEEAAAEFDASIHDEDHGDRRRTISRLGRRLACSRSGSSVWGTEGSEDLGLKSPGLGSAGPARVLGTGLPRGPRFGSRDSQQTALPPRIEAAP